MVTSVSAIVFVITLAAAGGAADTEKVNVTVLAVQATNEGRVPQRDEAAEGDSKPKRPAGAPYLQQGFAPGLRAKPKPKKNGNGDHRYFGPGLEGGRDAAASLPYDTFKKVKSQTSTLAFGKEVIFEINDRYKLHLTPLDKDSQGRLRINVLVDEHTKPNTLTALETTSAIAPNKYLVLGGRLPLAEGQLIVFISAQP